MEEQQSVVEVRDLVQKFFLKPVLNGVSLRLSPGECMGIFGLRGSGKTSLLHILAGVDRFTSGTVEVLGCNISKSQRFKQAIGLVTQEPSLFQDLSVLENLDFIAALKNVRQDGIERVTAQLELKDYLRHQVTALDFGLYQRLSLACALLNSPRLLIIDELIKDIDLYSRHLIIKQLKPFLQSGGACICGFSNMEMADIFDQVGWLENGQLEILAPLQAHEKWNNLVNSYKKPGDPEND
ncbi:MAG: ABC transporter ATP-binding protein [Firmicutes bacterium HGW-Firmicutes-15]|nr:MAG: ABC transporter ATP-binding protein [Firmicutes bacterium HGW-Firmicutes-15]